MESTNEDVTRFEWNIESFSRLPRKVLSPEFESGGYQWQIILFPEGNGVDGYISVYLSLVSSLEDQMDDSLQCMANFALILSNLQKPEMPFRKEMRHKFPWLRKNDGIDADRSWGVTRFIRRSEVVGSSSPYISNDRIKIVVQLLTERVSAFASEDAVGPEGSNLEYVGLRNQGATCYLNSLLQSLFHLGEFREAVYTLPTEEDSDPTKNLAFALQRVFYQMQFGHGSVGTRELTKSFGWDSLDSFIQHDVQELSRVLIDNIEQKMKNSLRAKGKLEQSDLEATPVHRLFTGKLENFVRCIDIDFTSTRLESFYDVSLNVKGCRNIYDSLDKYIEMETLDGENRYFAEGHGLQDAQKGSIFVNFPPVLNIQLKRFEYDPRRDDMVKINDSYEFPEVLELEKYLSPNSMDECTTFHLHGVLVHSGTVHGGHYYAFIRPSVTDESWYKFDDESVSVVSPKEAIQANFGGDDEVFSPWRTVRSFLHTRSSNAYMLVYIRDSDRDRVLTVPKIFQIPPHLSARFAREKIEETERRRIRTEAHLFVNLKIATEKDLREYTSNHFGLLDFEKLEPHKMKKKTSLKELKGWIEKETGISARHQRFWMWERRKNKTYRPDTSIRSRDLDRELGEISVQGELNLFLEDVSHYEKFQCNGFLPEHLESEALLFFKEYDPVKQSLGFLGARVVSKDALVGSLSTIYATLKMNSENVDVDIDIFEEMSTSPLNIPKMSPIQTIKGSELRDGDIIVFQRVTSDDTCHLSTAPKYYEFLLNRTSVQFRALEKPKETVVSLEVSKEMSYDTVTSVLGKAISVDPAKIRLTTHHGYFDQPKSTPVRRNDNMTLSDMLTSFPTSSQTCDILYFEVLDVPLVELENKKEIRVTFRRNSAYRHHKILLPTESTIFDIATQIAQLENVKDVTRIRVLEVFSSRIFKVFEHSEKLGSMDLNIDIHAEEISQDEIQLENKILIQVVHFTQTPTLHYFGIPFFVPIDKETTVEEFRGKLDEILTNVPPAELDKWKISAISMTAGPKVKSLKEGDVLSKYELSTFQEFLGLEHADMPTLTPRSRRMEKAISIKG